MLGIDLLESDVVNLGSGGKAPKRNKAGVFERGSRRNYLGGKPDGEKS